MLGGVYAFIALIFGGLLTLLSVLGVTLNPGGGNGGIMALAFGVGAIIIFPIVYFVCGLIGGILFALFYNVIAKVLGGIQFEVELTPEAPGRLS
jgi:hypothetical protein